MFKTDDEIRQIIKDHRLRFQSYLNNQRPGTVNDMVHSDSIYDFCPFSDLNYKNGMNTRQGCSICKNIMGTMPHVHTLIPKTITFAWRVPTPGKVHPTAVMYDVYTGRCPCLLYGTDFVAKKITEFMGE